MKLDHNPNFRRLASWLDRFLNNEDDHTGPPPALLVLLWPCHPAPA